MSQRTKWKAVLVAIGLPVLAMLVLLGVSLMKPLSFRIGNASFTVGTKEGMTLAPGRIMAYEVTRLPKQNIYDWYVKVGKRNLWVFTFT